MSEDAEMIIVGGMCQVEIDAANEYFRTQPEPAGDDVPF